MRSIVWIRDCVRISTRSTNRLERPGDTLRRLIDPIPGVEERAMAIGVLDDLAGERRAICTSSARLRALP
jgi:hypothetical protein